MTKTATTTPKVELKNLTLYAGMSEETLAFNATIYVDGKKAGDASNRGHGEPISYHFDDPDVRDRCEEWAKSLPADEADAGNGEAFTIESDLEYVLTMMVSEEDERRWLKRQCSRKVMFLLEGDRKGSYRGWKAKWTTGVKQELHEKYGDKLLQIVNERFGPPAVGDEPSDTPERDAGVDIKDLSVGDRVQVNNAVRPKFLAGATGTVTKKNRTKVVVNFDTTHYGPTGKPWGEKPINCPCSILKKIDN